MVSGIKTATDSLSTSMADSSDRSFPKITKFITRRLSLREGTVKTELTSSQRDFLTLKELRSTTSSSSERPNTDPRTTLGTEVSKKDTISTIMVSVGSTTVNS